PVVFANKAFCKYVHMNRQDVEGQSSKEIIGQSFNEYSKAIILEALEETNSVDLDIQTVFADDKKYLNLKLTPIHGGTGGRPLFVGIFTDTTELKLHELESSKTKKAGSSG